ncbi:MAG: hypothetical protein HQK99_12445 [Nitrospirae bacterium]|nr:hypothetical protein [Nitrospirota bacterium]
MKRIISLIIIALTMTVFSVFAFARGGDNHGGNNNQHRSDVRTGTGQNPGRTFSTNGQSRRGRSNKSGTVRKAAGASEYAPGHLKKKAGASANTPGASSYAPGHVKKASGAATTAPGAAPNAPSAAASAPNVPGGIPNAPSAPALPGQGR